MTKQHQEKATQEGKSTRDHAAMPRMTRFAAGSPCLLKQGSRPAIIKEARGAEQWLIRLFDKDTGEQTGTLQVIKSQQLHNARAADDHPMDPPEKQWQIWDWVEITDAQVTNPIHTGKYYISHINPRARKFKYNLN